MERFEVRLLEENVAGEDQTKAPKFLVFETELKSGKENSLNLKYLSEKHPSAYISSTRCFP